MDTKKPGLAIALLSGRPGMGKADDEDADDGGSDDYEDAASEVMDALKKDDKKAFAEALRSFVDMCHAEPDEDDSK